MHESERDLVDFKDFWVCCTESHRVLVDVGSRRGQSEHRDMKIDGRN